MGNAGKDENDSGVETIAAGEKKDGQLLSLLSQRISVFRKTLRDVFYGMTVHEIDVELRKEKGNLNNLFMLVVFGDFVGLPVIPPYYSMRLVPYIIPLLNTWKNSVLREKDITDIFTSDL